MDLRSGQSLLRRRLSTISRRSTFLHSLATKYDKPLLMTEVGYRSVDGTAIAPGSWTSSGTPDVMEQADAYNAFFQVWSAHGGSWFKGAELWQWDLNNQYSSTGYSVMGKPAETIVWQYFHGNGFVPGLSGVGLTGRRHHRSRPR